MQHFTHAADTEKHWTGRERDNLYKQLDRIEELLKESLTQRGLRSQGHSTNID